MPQAPCPATAITAILIVGWESNGQVDILPTNLPLRLRVEFRTGRCPRISFTPEGGRMPLYLTEGDVEQLLPMEMALERVERALVELGRGRATNEPRRRARVPGGMLHVMFAAEPEAGVMGLKAYTTFAGGARMHVLLYSAQDGALLALIEASRLGQLRTGAATGVATKYLARADAGIAAVIGTGYQAETQ